MYSDRIYLTETDKTSTMTQERFFELVYAWKDGDLTGDELYQRVFVLSNVVGQSEQFNCFLEDSEQGERCESRCKDCKEYKGSSN